MPKIKVATIEAGASVSSEVKTEERQRNFELSSVILEGSYGNSSFDLQANIDGTWFDVYDTFGSKFSITVNEGKHSLPIDVFKDVTSVRLKGGANELTEKTVKFILTDTLG